MNKKKSTTVSEKSLKVKDDYFLTKFTIIVLLVFIYHKYSLPSIIII